MQSYDYIEDRAISATQVKQRRKRDEGPRSRRKIDFDTKLRSLPTGSSILRLECRVPTQNYVRERFAVMTGNRRHDPAFKLLRAENQRRQDLSIARGNVQLSRTSGDWHPITAAEIAAIKAAEEAAAATAAQNSTPPRKCRGA